MGIGQNQQVGAESNFRYSYKLYNGLAIPSSKILENSLEIQVKIVIISRSFWNDLPRLHKGKNWEAGRENDR